MKPSRQTKSVIGALLGIALGTLSGAASSFTTAADSPVEPRAASSAASSSNEQETRRLGGLAPYHQIDQPITDAQGRVRVIVDFWDSAADRYRDDAQADFKRFDLKRDRHNPLVLRLLDAKGAQHGLAAEYRKNARGEKERTSVTTWVGASIAAYLTKDQISALRQDEDVRLLTEVGHVEYSANNPYWVPSGNDPTWFPEWTNGVPFGELKDWGAKAVGSRSLLPGSTRRVYVLDSGVAFHSDLGNVNRRNISPPPQSSDSYGSVVGCYAHATHIAGIIGATSNNGTGRQGIYAGVNIQSMNAGEATGESGQPNSNCTPSNSMNAETLGVMLDEVFWETLQLNSGPQIVNLSLNFQAGTGYRSNGEQEPNGIKIKNLATPRCVYVAGLCKWYYGNVVVQSAGNQLVDSCSTNNPGYPNSYAWKTGAYANSTAVDGVIVVGAINGDGRAIDSSAPQGHFSDSYPQPIDVNFHWSGEPGSNYGGCVDMWAPGNEIFSTWGAGLRSTRDLTVYAGQLNATCLAGSCTTPGSGEGWMLMSGTSMAAPHVAAVAAYVADYYGLTSPAAIEAKLRELAYTLPYLDSSGNSMRMVRMP